MNDIRVVNIYEMVTPVLPVRSGVLYHVECGSGREILSFRHKFMCHLFRSLFINVF